MKRVLKIMLLLTCAAIAVSVCLPSQRGQATQDVQEEMPSKQPERALLITGETQSRDGERELILYVDDDTRTLTLEEYLPGVLAGEMPADFHPEALKAQAIAARTYLLYKQSGGGCLSQPGADVCAVASCCAAYRTEAQLRERWGENFSENMEKIRQAVRDTDGLYLTYAGGPIQAVFHSSSAGMTEDSASVWKPLPYLVSVESPETAEDVPNYITEIEFSPEALRDMVKSVYPAAAFSDDPEQWLCGPYYDESGRVTYVSFGGVALSGMETRKIFGLRSTCFMVEYTGEAFLFRVTGYGHGVGMSQYGANVMAESGETFDAILAHYYPGTELVSLQ